MAGVYMTFYAFICLTCFKVVVHGNFKPICQPGSAKNAALSPKFPPIPTAFSTSLEANFANRNYTAIYEEYYDFEANRGSLEKTKDGKVIRSIYNYDQDELIMVDVNSKNCSVFQIDKLRNHCKFSFFGSNDSKIETVADLFKFTGRFKDAYSYSGVTTVRGVKCNHWQACIVTNFSSYYLDYYFSVPGWGTTWESANSTVFRAVINGTSQNFDCSGNGTWKPGNGSHDFYHVYDFFDFHHGSPDPSNFQLPEGFYCTGLKGPNITLPVVPPVFSMEIEIVLASDGHVSNWQEVYDLERKLVMFRGPNYWNPSLGPIIQIHDFNTGIGYNISTPSDGNYPGCRLFHLTDQNLDATDDGHHHVRMKTTQELFKNPRNNDTAPVVYKGLASVRGIDTDIWVSKGRRQSRQGNSSYEVVVEWYFSKPSWNVSAGSAVEQHQVPLKIISYSPHRKLNMNVFNFDAEPAQPTAFDIKPCFSSEQQVFIQFNLQSGQHHYVGWRGFMLAVTKSISSAAGVTLIRVNGIRLSYKKYGGIVVTFILLGKPTIKAELSGDTSNEKGLEDALKALRSSVESGSFVVKFEKGTLYAEKTSFFVGFQTNPSSSPVNPTAKPSSQPQPGAGETSGKKGVSGGAVAGIAFLMIAIGIVGGLGIAHLMMKRRGTSLFQYQRHE